MDCLAHPSLPSPLRLLVLGYGNVARALLPLLVSRAEWLQHTLNISLLVSGIGTRSKGFYIHPRGVALESLNSVSDPLLYFHQQAQRVSDAESFVRQGKTAGASLLIELTTLHPQDGQPALTHIRTALNNGLHVVTANKGPIAYAQQELQMLARQHMVQLRFESTVMDGLPLINLAQFTLPAVGLRSFRATLNATSSLVLAMIEQGFTLEAAILRARELGIAEADPWYDLDGWDAAMKTTILANTLFSAQLTPVQVKRNGIHDLPVEAIRQAAAEGEVIRLVSQARRQDDVVIAEVMPQALAAHDVLRSGRGTNSVVSLETEAMGTITLVEHEPMVQQTAYGIFSDLVTILSQSS